MPSRCEEILSSPRWMLELLGCWPVKLRTRAYNIKLFIASAFTFAFPAMMCFEVYFVYNNYNAVLQVLNFLMPYVYVLSKYSIFTCRQENVFVLLNYTESKIFNSFYADSDKILKSTSGVIVIVTKVFRFSFVLAIVMIALLPLSGMLYPVPISHDIGNYSLLMYIFQLTSLGIGGWLCIGFDCTFIAFTAVAIAQINILKLRLSSIVKDVGYNRNAFTNLPIIKDIEFQLEIKRILNICVLHHLAIVEYVKRLSNLFSITIFIQYLMTIVALAITLNRILIIQKLSVQILELLFVLMFILTQLVTYSYSGNQIMVKSSEIGEACYMGQWYYYDVSNRKTLFIIMERMKRPLYIKASMFANTTLETCVQILRSTYSIFSILSMTYGED